MLLSNIKDDSTISNFKTPNSIVNKLVSNTLNSIPEAITICDKNGIILKINSKASRLFGWTDNELIEKKTFEILLTNRYRNTILYQLKKDPSSILNTSHFVYGLKKDGKTFPANLLISSFSRDFLVKDRKTYLIVFSTSFIISQLKSNEPVTTKFYDGDQYSKFKEKQHLPLENHQVPKSNSNWNSLFNEKNHENMVFQETNNQKDPQNERMENHKIIDTMPQKEEFIDKMVNFNTIKNEDKENNNSNLENKNKGTLLYPTNEKMIMYQDEVEDENDKGEENGQEENVRDHYSLPLRNSSSNVSTNKLHSSFKGDKTIRSASIPISKEKIEVIPTYIPSSIQNFSFYTSPWKRNSSVNKEGGLSEPKTNGMTYSRYQNEFEEITKLGKGGFGSVYQVRNKLDGQFYAIKKIKLQCDPQNTMECVMNSDFFNPPLTQDSLSKEENHESLSNTIQDTFLLNSSSKPNEKIITNNTNCKNNNNKNNNNNNNHNTNVNNNNNYNNININTNNNKDININASLPTNSNKTTISNTNNNSNLPRRVYHRRYMSATTSLSAATSKFPINTLSTKDIRIIQEVKTFARISNHPNIVRYHGAWIEALEMTESGSDVESSDSDTSNDSFDEDLNSVTSHDSSDSEMDKDESFLSTTFDNDSDNDTESSDSEEEEDEDDDDETDFSLEIHSEIDNDHTNDPKENDDFEIVFERNHDIYIDINDSTSKESVSSIQQKYRRNSRTKSIKSSKLKQELLQTDEIEKSQLPELKINDNHFDPRKDKEDSFIISFEENDEDKSYSFLMNNPNSTSSFISNSSVTSLTSINSENEKSKSNSLKVIKKHKKSKKNDNLFIHALKKRKKDYLKNDGKSTLTETLSNLTIPPINNYNHFSSIHSNSKYRPKNSPTLSIIEENCNSSSYFSDNTSIISNSLIQTLNHNDSSTVSPTSQDTDHLFDISKQTIVPTKKESILSSSLCENSRTRLIDRRNSVKGYSSTLTNEKDNFGTLDTGIDHFTLNHRRYSYPSESYQRQGQDPNFHDSIKDSTLLQNPGQASIPKVSFNPSRNPYTLQEPSLSTYPTKSKAVDERNKESSKKLCSVLLIQMEFVSGQTLQAWLEERNTSSNPVVDRKMVMKIFKQIVQGLAHIHWNGFIHCDIKPANIFLQEDQHILIGDFGLAKKIVTDSSSLEQDDDELMGAGTYLYASPEQLSEHRCYDNKTDIYSLGILLFELLCPFSTGMERVKTLMDIRQGKFSDEFIKTWPREFLLIKSLLQPDPLERPTALEILDSEILLNNYPLYDTTDLLVALDLHISPEQGYNKNNIELNHFSSNLKKYNYPNNSPSISSLRSKNSMTDGKLLTTQTSNTKTSKDNESYGSYGSTSHKNKINTTKYGMRSVNEATNTTAIKTVNASTYVNYRCHQCQKKDLIISSFQLKDKNSETIIKNLQDSLQKANRRIFIYNILSVLIGFVFLLFFKSYYFQ